MLIENIVSSPLACKGAMKTCIGSCEIFNIATVYHVICHDLVTVTIGLC